MNLRTKLFQTKGYKTILKDSLLELKEKYGKPYTFEKMAAACRIQRTYLSNILSGTSHLNSDQLYAACQFMGFNPDEYHYTRLVHELERSTFQQRRDNLTQEIDQFMRQKLQTSSYLKHKQTPPKVEEMSSFYLDFNAQLLYALLTIPRYRKQPKSVIRDVGIEAEQLTLTLEKLERLGLIAIKGDQIKLNHCDFHLEPSSPIYPLYRSQMRLKALHRMESSSKEESYNFSVLFSTTAGTRTKIQMRFLEFLQWVQETVKNEAEEEVYQINFDLLRWSRG